MTSINDIADLARIIRERPEWADTLRNILLGQELLELPERFAEFVQQADSNFQAVNERQDGLEAALADFVRETDRNFQAVNERQDRFEARLDDFIRETRNFQLVNENLQAVNERQDRLEARLDDFIRETNRNFQLVNERQDRLEAALPISSGRRTATSSWSTRTSSCSMSGMTCKRPERPSSKPP